MTKNWRRPRSAATLLAIPLLGTLILMLMPAIPAAATTTVGVNATPYNNGSHRWGTDGCSWVSDYGIHGMNVYYGSPPWGAALYTTATWDFNHACIHHDGCYGAHWASRATCDWWFLNDMRASCDAMHSNAARRLVCRDKAGQYYTGVRALGGPAYDGWSAYIRILA
jgi:hypothetical protein